eukprot:TRINITY_DN25140_c0_g1_i1.p1 TRINITY_DN25140_c0_g1~~TRINITY_DN25140_c0_g1_i1.p1  ORF type:complete len:665 (+),score=255.38 TRINITY_DN25140_c0_g1_i1:164-2158(+)
MSTRSGLSGMASSPMEIVNMMSSSNNSSSSHRGSQDPSSQEAIESLLLLGQEPILGPKKSSDELEILSSSVSCSSEGISYYQRMRIRNNEASKRCRLKRRLKAEQLEGQHNLLSLSNKLLKQRIARLNSIVNLLKNCVKDLQEPEGTEGTEESPCTCLDTVAAIKKCNREGSDNSGLSTEELIDKSRLNRELEDVAEVYLDMERRSSSSDDEKKPKLSRSLSAQPVLINNRTSLDIINETIVKTLTNPLLSAPKASISISAPSPQTIVKPIMNSSAVKPPILPSSSSTALNVIPPQLVFVTTKSPSPSSPKSSAKEVLIKCEPDLRVVEEVVETSNVILPPTPSIVSSSPCIIMSTENPYKDTPCGYELHSINKLSGYLDLVSRTFSRDDGSSAAERVIVKSALGLPFWQADEHPAFICDNHRQEISFQTDHSSCVLCGKKKKKPFPTSMSVITYRMSLEHHMNSGKILPIGQLLCSSCKDRYLKLDPKPQSLESFPPVLELQQPNNNTLIFNKQQKDVKVIVQPVPRVHSLTSSNNSQLVSICAPNNSAPEPSPTTSLVPTSATAANNGNDNIFHKISRLNDALQAVNPRYKPIGFSITSIESCSPSVLQDAIAATDTAVSTLLSVIAPGQESLLWESVKAKLNEKYSNPNKTSTAASISSIS